MAVDKDAVAEILRSAEEAVKAARLSDAYQITGFEKAVDMFAAGAGLVSAPATAAPPEAAAKPAAAPSRGAGADRTLEKIAGRVGISVDLIEQVYEVHDGELTVIVPTSKLTQRARPAMRELILLTAAGRQAGGWDEGSTSIETVRGVCEHYGGRYYDSNNFRNAIADLSDYLRSSGGRRDATVRVLPAGYTRAGEHIKELLGGDKK